MTDETSVSGETATAAASNEAPETSAPQTDAPPEGVVEAPAPKAKGVQKRIDELTANWRNEQRRAERLESMLAETINPKPAPAAPTGKPTLDQFEYDQERYLDALADWKIAEKERAFEEKRKKDAEESARTTRAKTFAEREAEAAAKFEDYHELAHDPTLPVSDAMAQAILDIEEGPQVLYYLGQNRSEAARIAQMSPAAASVAIGRIVARLETPAPSAEPQVSAAPAPIKTVKPSAPTPKGLHDGLSVNEWLKERRKQLASKAS